MYFIIISTECLLSVWVPPPCDERRSLHDPSDRSSHLCSQRRPQAHVHRALTQAQSALFEVVHKSLHAVKPGRELGQVIFQRVELPVEVPHGVRQGPDPGRFHREKRTVVVKASWLSAERKLQEWRQESNLKVILSKQSSPVRRHPDKSWNKTCACGNMKLQNLLIFGLKCTEPADQIQNISKRSAKKRVSHSWKHLPGSYQ